MKNFYPVIFVLLALSLHSCKMTPLFKSSVDTKVKPWTNLNFNNDPQHFQFAIMADRNGGSRAGVFEDAVRKINLVQPEFVLTVGDMIAGYSTDTAEIGREWKEADHIIAGLKMPYFYLPGNHDITNEVMAKEWEKRFGERYYSFNYKNVLFLILDSNDDKTYNLTQKQTDFAIAELKKYPSVRWTFLLMHHPIWNYQTNGRFQAIEQALKGRKFSVIAGHEHHYHQREKDGANYYILSTTGAGSALRGNYFGEFDHIAWITMANDCPIMANLKLDGILPHDISNDRTNELAKPLISNAAMNHVFLTNQGENFSHGTLYLAFDNPTKLSLDVSLNFFHHHQLKISNPHPSITIDPGKRLVVEVQVSSDVPLEYDQLELLLYNWQIKYNSSDYKDFMLSGKSQIEIKASTTHFIDREVDLFTEPISVVFNHPYQQLESHFVVNQDNDKIMQDTLKIGQTTNLSCYLANSRDEVTLPENRSFVKTTFRKSVQVAKAVSGLAYQLYPGNWQTMPEFSALKAMKKENCTTFLFSSISGGEKQWATVFEGFFEATEDQIYQFRMRTGDLCRLVVDNETIADEKSFQSNEAVGSIALQKGFHHFRLAYLKKTDDPRLRFYYKKAGEEGWKAMDASSFFRPE